MTLSFVDPLRRWDMIWMASLVIFQPHRSPDVTRAFFCIMMTSYHHIIPEPCHSWYHTQVGSKKHVPPGAKIKTPPPASFSPSLQKRSQYKSNLPSLGSMDPFGSQSALLSGVTCLVGLESWVGPWYLKYTILVATHLTSSGCGWFPDSIHSEHP